MTPPADHPPTALHVVDIQRPGLPHLWALEVVRPGGGRGNVQSVMVSVLTGLGPASYHGEVASMSVARQIQASPTAVYRALTDGEAVSRWRAPDGMTASVHEFDPSEGGAFRISLSYDDESRSGKTTENVDTYHGYFRELITDRRVVEVIEFEASNPELTNEMTVTTSLEAIGGQTEVVVVFEGLPDGISEEDNAIGTAMSLANLARLVEGPDQ